MRFEANGHSIRATQQCNMEVQRKKHLQRRVQHKKASSISTIYLRYWPAAVFVPCRENIQYKMYTDFYRIALAHTTFFSAVGVFPLSFSSSRNNSFQSNHSANKSNTLHFHESQPARMRSFVSVTVYTVTRFHLGLVGPEQDSATRIQ